MGYQGIPATNGIPATKIFIRGTPKGYKYTYYLCVDIYNQGDASNQGDNSNKGITNNQILAIKGMPAMGNQQSDTSKHWDMAHKTRNEISYVQLVYQISVDGHINSQFQQGVLARGYPTRAYQ